MINLILKIFHNNKLFQTILKEKSIGPDLTHKNIGHYCGTKRSMHNDGIKSRDLNN